MFSPNNLPSASRSVTKLFFSYHFSLSWFDLTLVLALAFSGANVKSSGDKASPGFRPLWKKTSVGEMFAYRAVLHVVLQHMSNDLSSFLVITNSI